MRTTIQFNKSTFSKIKLLQARKGSTLSETVNDLVEQALVSKKEAPVQKFKIKPRKMGIIPGLDYSNTGKLLEMAEGPAYK